VLGYSPLEAGLAFLPVTFGIGAGAGIAQQFVKRFGPRTTATVGMLIAAVGLWYMSNASVDGTYLTDVLPAIVPMSVGMGLTFVPVTLIATTGVADEDAGLASGLFNTAQQVGGALGLAVLSTLAADKTASSLSALGHRPTPADTASALLDGFNVAFVAAAILVAVSAVLLLVAVRKQDVAAIDTDAAPLPA
jgi:fucose permease